jgi:integrase
MSTRSTRRGHVRQRGATFTAYWRARDENGRSVQRTKGGFASAGAAEKYLTRVLRDLDTGLYVEPDRKARAQTLSQFVRDTWLPAVKASLRPSTYAGYIEKLESYVLPRLGSLRLGEITPDKLNRLYGELRASGRVHGTDDNTGLSSKTVRHVPVTLHRVLADAVQWDRIARNPADRATPPKPERVEMKTWSPEQLRAFLDSVRGDRLYAAWHLLVTTGVRRGELLGLRWDDVDLDGEWLAVRQTLIAIKYEIQFSAPKTERSRRRIGLDPATVAALRAHRAAQLEERLLWGEAWTDSGLVFTREDGAPIHPHTLSQTFERRAKAAKLPAIRLHDLRHSYATAALRAGVPPRMLSERLGHSSTALTTDTYQHVAPEMDEEVAAKVAAVILGG